MPVSLDPAVFDPENEPPDARALNAAILLRLAGWDNFALPVPEVRAIRREGRGPFPAPTLSDRARTITIEGRRGPLALRVLAPDQPRGVYLHIHGGGWMLGDADMQDQRLERLVDNVGLACVSVHYGKAPEHPYPMGADDCEDAALWLTREAKARFGTDRLLIGGESAGAHLSATTLLRLRDRHGLAPFAGANLTAGCYDLALTPSVRHWKGGKLVLDDRDIRLFVKHYLVRGGDVADPDVSPIQADLSGMPPALFTVGTRDPLLDDSLFMAAKWQAAGNATDLEVYPGGCHVFIAFPGRNTEACLNRIDAFLAARLAD